MEVRIGVISSLLPHACYAPVKHGSSRRSRARLLSQVHDSRIMKKYGRKTAADAYACAGVLSVCHVQIKGSGHLEVDTLDERRGRRAVENYV